ncbi:hypothetical protein BURPS1106B_1574 [Burkholderia pseudomallei 1106b]|uniref:Uncharacterized protein n=1 Tax=Burkholderia pseudomallei (strain 1106a) TaxID=357348 RepID=A3P2A2_BURP0|nr:hypothetical protein BURPS1106A_A0419 [Burkholderia pseudomallei 1106a]EES21991.1 hypothetical protein BURPS1106B_1574 [Burkholderia pseudomallei 1106b]
MPAGAHGRRNANVGRGARGQAETRGARRRADGIDRASAGTFENLREAGPEKRRLRT